MASPGSTASARFARIAISFAACFAAGAACAQPTGEARSIVVGGETVEYRLIDHSRLASTDADAGGALDTARRLHAHLAAGDIESAALLSTAPKRRFEVLRDYREAVGEGEFRRVFAQYQSLAHRPLAEAAIGAHRLLVWELRDSGRLAGQYYVEVEGRMLLDDAPSETRLRLRAVLEAYRGGRIARPEAAVTPSSRTD